MRGIKVMYKNGKFTASYTNNFHSRHYTDSMFHGCSEAWYEQEKLIALELVQKYLPTGNEWGWKYEDLFVISTGEWFGDPFYVVASKKDI
jgi:hypothetical protein